MPSSTSPLGYPSLAAMLTAAADALRTGAVSPSLAAELLTVAAAAAKPIGYGLRVYGAMSHDYFVPTPDGAIRAGRDAGLAAHEMVVVPLIPVDIATE